MYDVYEINKAQRRVGEIFFFTKYLIKNESSLILLLIICSGDAEIVVYICYN